MGFVPNAYSDELKISERFLKYDIALAGARVGVLKIGTWTSKSENPDEDGQFKADAYLRTTGLLGMTFDTKLNAVASGIVLENGYRPKNFSTEYTKKGKPQILKMSFNDTQLIKQIAEPAYRTTDYQIDPEQQENVMDPVTLGLTGFIGYRGENPCTQILSGFDGRKRFEMRFAPHADNDASQESRHCVGDFVRVAGYKAKYMKRPNYKFEVWYQRDVDGLFQATKIAGFTKFGPASATLRN